MVKEVKVGGAPAEYVEHRKAPEIVESVCLKVHNS